MFVYYAGTLLFRAWILEDVINQPLPVENYSAEVNIKRSADSEEVLFTGSTEESQLVLQYDEDVPASWLEWRMDELDLDPGDYVFYVYVYTPEKQLVEHGHLLIMASSAEEVTP